MPLLTEHSLPQSASLGFYVNFPVRQHQTIPLPTVKLLEGYGMVRNMWVPQDLSPTTLLFFGFFPGDESLFSAMGSWLEFKYKMFTVGSHLQIVESCVNLFRWIIKWSLLKLKHSLCFISGRRKVNWWGWMSISRLCPYPESFCNLEALPICLYWIWLGEYLERCWAMLALMGSSHLRE